MRNFFAAVTRHPLGLAGAALTTASALVFAFLFALDLAGLHATPYVGIIAYLIVPAFFIFGLLLIPLGVWRDRRLRRARKADEPLLPVIDMNRPRTRGIVVVFLALTAANVVILAAATYKGVEVMDSTRFCGQTCHTVMQPEFTAHERSPHARVACVDCHIGPGGSWFVKSKLSGTWQVISVAFHLYPRPIPTPVHNLRPARETCEQCHWPTKFVGDRLRVITHHNDDEKSTQTKTVLLMKIGGLQDRGSQGIHWHVDPGVRIRYRADEKREKIAEVELTRPGEAPRRYVTETAAAGTDGKAAAPANGKAAAAGNGDGEWRVMDCVDCHNRPTHIYRTPEDEVDQALTEGRLEAALPFARREAIKALKTDYESHEAARAGIATAFAAFYQKDYPQIASDRRADIERSGRMLGDLYALNVFPKMNVKWGTYPNHLGHVTSDGCFRCHDDKHKTSDGKVIPGDCDLCHSVLAMDEESPKVLETLKP
jgi:nitrate/TMAO reductase-like tetraheme cytochrome c subunit